MTEKEKKIKRVVKAVILQLIAMYNNNVIGEFRQEPFFTWLEDGDVLRTIVSSDEEYLMAWDFAKEIAPSVDEINNAIVKIGFDDLCA